MSTKDPITCFDNSECIYEKCSLFNEALDTCKLESLKGTAAPVAQTELPKETEPDEGFVKDRFYDISGTISSDPILRKGTSKAGKDWKLAGFNMDLSETSVRITLWNQLAGEAMQYTAGENIALNDMVVKDFYEGTPQLSSVNKTKITVL